ncbi:MAG TPA: hypothetical protein VEC17_03120 [Candidatus Binatia bacterium]|nr:hypothetical protein [Candidatus Binatia bacterium]
MTPYAGSVACVEQIDSRITISGITPLDAQEVLLTSGVLVFSELGQLSVHVQDNCTQLEFSAEADPSVVDTVVEVLRNKLNAHIDNDLMYQALTAGSRPLRGRKRRIPLLLNVGKRPPQTHPTSFVM